jgi:hypothetical protein
MLGTGVDLPSQFQKERLAFPVVAFQLSGPKLEVQTLLEETLVFVRLQSCHCLPKLLAPICNCMDTLEYSLIWAPLEVGSLERHSDCAGNAHFTSIAFKIPAPLIVSRNR